MTYTTIGPRSRATAEALLAAAESVGVPKTQVRTMIRGYIVPDAVAAQYRKMQAGETDPIDEEPVEVEEVTVTGLPNESWKVAEIRAYAEEHGFEFDGYVKKADMLAAITADTKEE